MDPTDCFTPKNGPHSLYVANRKIYNTGCLDGNIDPTEYFSVYIFQVFRYQQKSTHVVLHRKNGHHQLFSQKKWTALIVLQENGPH